MVTVGIICAALVLAYLALGAFVESGLRARRERRRPAPPAEQDRDTRWN